MQLKRRENKQNVLIEIHAQANRNELLLWLECRLQFPLTHPCHSPHALKGQKLLAQGIRPGYSCPHAWRPVGAKALYGDRTSGFAPHSILELAMEFCHVNRTMHFLYIRKKNIYLRIKIKRTWIRAYIHIYIIKS